MPSHLASLERRACRWSGSAGSTSGLLAKWVQNGTVRRTALPTDNADTNTLKKQRVTEHMFHRFPFVAAPKYSSVIRGLFTPQRMLSRNVNTSWVSAHQLFIINAQSLQVGWWFDFMLWICSDEAPGQIQRIQTKGWIQKAERSRWVPQHVTQTRPMCWFVVWVKGRLLARCFYFDILSH